MARRRDRRRNVEQVAPVLSDARRPAAHRPDPQVSQRSKFRVARVQRQVAETLPDLLIGDRAARDLVRPALSARYQDDQALYAPPVSRRAPLDPPRSLSDRAPDLSLKDAPVNCKSRPARSRRGGGSGRPFVPWCR